MIAAAVLFVVRCLLFGMRCVLFVVCHFSPCVACCLRLIAGCCLLFVVRVGLCVVRCSLLAVYRVSR